MADMGDTVKVTHGSYQGKTGTIVHTTPQKARIRLPNGEVSGLLFKTHLVAAAENAPGTAAATLSTNVPKAVAADDARKAEASTMQVAAAVVAYSFCSSMMVVANKLAVSALPISAVVTQVQFIFATVAVLVFGLFGEDIGPFEFKIFRGYFIYILAFAGGIYANMQGLKKLSPETTTVVRSCLPIIVLVIEYLFMGRDLPNLQSALALGGVVAGASAYFYVTGGEVKANEITTYYWCLAWYLLLAFQMTYGKMLVKDYALSRSGRVLYQNAISIPVILALGMAVGDYDEIDRLSFSGLTMHFENAAEEEKSHYGLLWLTLSSFIGLGIGYTAWACRQFVTPTSFTLIGVVNKIFTILMSITFINSNATVYSVTALAVCIMCGMCYRPPPLRKVEKQE